MTVGLLVVIGGLIFHNWHYLRDEQYSELGLWLMGVVTVVGLIELQLYKVIITDTLVIKKSILGMKQFKVSEISSYEIREFSHKSRRSYYLFLLNAKGQALLKVSDSLSSWHFATEWAKKNFVDLEKLTAEEEDQKILGKKFENHTPEIEVDIQLLYGVGILSLLVFGLGKVQIPYQIYLGLIAYLLIRHHFAHGQITYFPFNRHSIRASIGPLVLLLVVNFWFQVLLLPIQEHDLHHLFHFMFSLTYVSIIFSQTKREKKKIIPVVLLLVTSAFLGHGMALLFNAN